MTTPTKRLALKRETVRSLNMRAGIRTGIPAGNDTGIVLPPTSFPPKTSNGGIGTAGDTFMPDNDPVFTSGRPPVQNI